jgi:BirA family transcriptional regulator, biotin operon repressor / biotin---[acetyl-CoA-carboxylase] ligase
MIGRKIIHLERVDSTNNYIANLLSRAEIDSGTVILADEQTQGRGQRGSVWSSNSAENMLFSLFLATEILSVKDQFVLSQFVSVSLVNMLNNFGLNAKVKWPNDIYVNEKKIAGILIENQLSGSVLKSSIIGVGLNVNQKEFENISATSLMKELGEFIPIQSVLLSFIFELNKSWELILSNKVAEIERKYLCNLYQKGIMCSYEDELGVFSAVIEGVNSNGNLILKSSEREKLYYDLKEVSFK